MSSRPTHPLRLYGHRGAPREQPENSVPSFRRALELGVDALEMDVHLTADGHVVVSHDPSGQRTAGVPERIRSCTLKQVQSWELGSRTSAPDEPPRDGGAAYRIPTLDEVLEEFPLVTLNVDIKQTEPPMVEPLLAVVRRHQADPRVVLASFGASTMRAVRSGGFQGETALARGEVLSLLAVPRLLRRLRPLAGSAAQLPERVGPMDFTTPRFIDRCHALGLRIDYWTVNDPERAEQLLEMGADGIMTDDPAALGPMFARWRATTDR